MIDYTRTEKIGGDSIYFCGHPNRVGNRYDKYCWQLIDRVDDLDRDNVGMCKVLVELTKMIDPGST